MNRGCCNECGYKADYIIDKNNCEANGYERLKAIEDRHQLSLTKIGKPKWLRKSEENQHDTT